ncbi:hypothetical protein AB0C02_00590 [Micromonospora sp. NPDC048999]|uniref:hypothetical protein n=1 Tax=Micromonospora sp. NPDC048999 TaxID=3155391 RepID=UPI003403BED7
MNEQSSAAKNRYLVLHDYGMGGLWWWVWARSAEEILDAVAEVEVVTDDAVVHSMGSDELDEVDLDALPDSPLADLHEQRLAHRDLPGYGVLANRYRVYLRDASPDYDGVVYLAELGPDGRRLREVEQRLDGDSLRTDDWPFNSPIDLRDPQYVPMQISAEAFEDAWRRARPDPDAL